MCPMYSAYKFVGGWGFPVLLVVIMVIDTGNNIMYIQNINVTENRSTDSQQ